MKGTLAFILILACIGGSQALQCYTCGGSSSCAEPFTSSTKATCQSVLGTPACLKSKAGDLVLRSCTTSLLCLKGDNTCYTEGESDLCCCTGELCNGASTRAVNYVTLATLMIMGSVLAAL